MLAEENISLDHVFWIYVHFLGAQLGRKTRTRGKSFLPKLCFRMDLFAFKARWFLYLLTYSLTPRCRVLLEQLTGLQPVKKFLTFHRTRRFITALTSVRHLSLSWASPIQSIYPHPTSWRSILILVNTLHDLSLLGRTDARFLGAGVLLNLLNAEFNPICHLLALLGAHHILHVSRVRVKSHLPSAGIIRSSPYSPR